MIRNASSSDANKICAIYNYYIKNTVVTFEETEVDDYEMENRINEVQDNFFWIVYEENKEIKGYAYINSFRKRSAYDKTVECSIYVENGQSGKGIGSALFEELINKAKKMNFHVLTSCITLPNEKSEILHNKFAFKKVAHFKEVGHKFDKWLDVGYWQLIIGTKI